MKKLKNVLLASGIILFLASCSNGSSDGSSSSINRNKELKISSVRQISLPYTITSAQAKGKKVFLIAQNLTEDDQVIFPNSSIHRAIEDYKDAIIKNGLYVNIPNENVRNIPASSLNRNINSNIYGNNSTLMNWGTANHIVYASNQDGSNASPLTATYKARGQYCEVWYSEKPGVTVNNTEFQKLADKFDAIYLKETELFGSNRLTKTGGDGFSITATEDHPIVRILVYDLHNDSETTKTTHAGTFGYFRGIDLLNVTNSNLCECIHIDSYFLSVAPKQVYSTLGHEFQHLLNFVNKALERRENNSTIPLDNADYISETWFTEMMSMVCEDIMLTQLQLPVTAGPQSRLNTFNRNYYYGFQSWYGGDAVFISYANAYAFGAFLLRNYGIDCISAIAKNEYMNEEAIVHGVQAYDTSITSFNDIVTKFYNVMLNPKSTYYTLNKKAEKTINVSGLGPVTFTCDPINLFDYKAFEASEVTKDLVEEVYQSEKGKAYYGPLVTKDFLMDLGVKGTSIGYLKVGKNDYLIPDYLNSNVTYYLAFAD